MDEKSTRPFRGEENLPALKTFLLSLDDRHLSEMRRLYETYRDPLYAWEAVHYCQLPPLDRYNNLSGLEEMKAFILPDGSFSEHGDFEGYGLFFTALSESPKKLLIPDWCSAYLSQSAEEIFALYADVVPVTGEKVLSATAAAGKIPKIFGFVAKGKNSFLNYVRDVRRGELISRFKELVDYEGFTKAEARRIILEEAELNDERNLQRIISNVLKRTGKT